MYLGLGVARLTVLTQKAFEFSVIGKLRSKLL